MENEEKVAPALLSKKNILIAVVALVVVAGVILIASGGLGGSFSSRQVVASVNGENITKGLLEKRVDQSRALYEAEGLDLSDPDVYNLVREQVLQSVIQEMLIMQDAAKQNIAAGEEEVDVEYGQIEARFASEDEFLGELALYNISKAELREHIFVQLTIQAYLDANMNPDALEVSEDEIADFYEVYSEGNDDAPALNEVGAQIEAQLAQEKRQGEVERILQELEERGDVRVLI